MEHFNLFSLKQLFHCLEVEHEFQSARRLPVTTAQKELSLRLKDSDVIPSGSIFYFIFFITCISCFFCIMELKQAYRGFPSCLPFWTLTRPRPVSFQTKLQNLMPSKPALGCCNGEYPWCEFMLDPGELCPSAHLSAFRNWACTNHDSCCTLSF